MEWIIDHLQFVIAIIIFAVIALRKLTQGKEEPPGQSPAAEDQNPWSEDDPEEAERTRRIQEEIRRRILERQQGGSAVEGSGPPVVVFRPEDEESEWREEGPRPRAPKPPPIPKAPALDVAAMAILEQQRLLAAQLEAVRSARAIGRTGIPQAAQMASYQAASWAIGGSVEGLRQAIGQDLKSPLGLRRALVMREILGEPLGLQQGMPRLPRR